MGSNPVSREALHRSARPADSERAGQLNIDIDIDADFHNRLVYRLLLAIDIEGYSRRDAREQLRTQQDLNAILDIAAENSGLDRARWDKQVGGDGEMAILPEDVDVLRVVEHFTRALTVALSRVNRDRGDRPRLRVRLAFHHGTLTSGPFGPAGDAPIVVSRLLDSKVLRRLLKEEPDRDLAFIVSDSLYRDVIGTGFCSLDPAAFQQVRMRSKGLSHRGFMYVRASMAVTRRPAAVAAPSMAATASPAMGSPASAAMTASLTS